MNNLTQLVQKIPIPLTLNSFIIYLLNIKSSNHCADLYHIVLIIIAIFILAYTSTTKNLFS